jgi:hypothetical protein
VEDHRVPRGPGVEGGEDLVDRLAAALGVAGVDHDRQVELDRDLDLGGESAPLVLAGGAVSVVVEPGLTDRPHLLESAEASDFGPGLGVEAGRLVGVAADRGEDVLVALGCGDRGRVRLRIHANRQHPLDPRLAGSRHDLVLASLAEEEVGVGVDHR